MKYFPFLLFLLIFRLTGQDYSFKPVDPDSVLSIKYSHIKLFQSNDFTNPFDSSEVFSGSQYSNEFWHKYDSCLSGTGKYTKRQTKIQTDCIQEVIKSDNDGTFGKVTKSSVLLESEDHSLILFQNNEISPNEYWIGISDGTNWNHYSLGINEGAFLWIKRKSFLPLLKNDTLLQFEAALIRQVTPEILPSGAPVFQLVKDFIRIEIDLQEVRKDSDEDGLTDQLELKMGTNPLLSDTDLDGNSDKEDLVPANFGDVTPETALISALLTLKGDSCKIPFDHTEPSCPEIMLSKKVQRELTNASFEMPIQNLIILSDLPGIGQIRSEKDRLFPMTTQQYKIYRETNIKELDVIRFSKLVPVDEVENKFVLSMTGGFWGSEYEVTKSETFWIVELISTWII